MREKLGLKFLTLFVSLLAISTANATQQEDEGPGATAPPGINFERLPSDIQARILREAAGGNVKEIVKFGAVSRSLHNAVERALKHLPVHIDIGMVTEASIKSLSVVNDLALKLSDTEKNYTADQWNEKLKLIGQLKGVKVLDLGGTNVQVQDLTPLSSMTGLQELNLYGVYQLKDITPLKGLVNLRTLVLGYTQVSDISALENLVNLEKLNLSGPPGTKAVGYVSDIRVLSRLSHLRELDLSSTTVVDLEPMKDLKELESIDLSGTNIRDLSPLSNITNLKVIMLYNASVDRQQVAALQKKLPKVKIKYIM